MSQFIRNQTVLVCKDVTTANATGIQYMEDGEIIWLDGNGDPYIGAGYPADGIIQPVLGTSTTNTAGYNEVIWGPRIQVANIRKLSYKEYNAADVQVTNVGRSGNSTGGHFTATASKEYTLHILFTWDKSVWSKRPARRSFSYTTDATAAKQTIIDAFVTLINADEECATQLTASRGSSSTTSYLILTAKTPTYNGLNPDEWVVFEVSVDGEWADNCYVQEFGYTRVGTTTGAYDGYSTAPDKGVGTYEEVRDLEWFALGNIGVTNRTQFPVPAGVINAASGSTYNMLVLDFDDVHESASLNREIASPEQVIFCGVYRLNPANSVILRTANLLNTVIQNYAPSVATVDATNAGEGVTTEPW